VANPKDNDARKQRFNLSFSREILLSAVFTLAGVILGSIVPMILQGFSQNTALAPFVLLLSSLIVIGIIMASLLILLENRSREREALKTELLMSHSKLLKDIHRSTQTIIDEKVGEK